MKIVAFRLFSSSLSSTPLRSCEMDFCVHGIASSFFDARKEVNTENEEWQHGLVNWGAIRWVLQVFPSEKF